AGVCQWWPAPIPARPARAVSFSIAPTAVRRRSFTAACAASDATRTSTLPATAATNTLPVSVDPSLAGRCQTAHRLGPLGWRQVPGFSRGVSDVYLSVQLGPRLPRTVSLSDRVPLL